MKRIVALVAMQVAMLAAWPASAQPGPPAERRGERMGPPPGRPMQAPRHTGFPGRPPMDRMTPEERRQLRQDIHQHGRDVYRPRREDDKK